jgi:hypothetical protein
MKIHMYESLPNFGDVLNKFIWPKHFGPYLQRDDDILMFGIGTLLGQKTEHAGKIIVVGSGCGYEPNINISGETNWNIFFVRGPLSAHVLRIDQQKAVTDPAIITPEFFPKASSSGRAVFIPHWETAYNPLWRSACRLAGLDYVDPLANIEDVIRSLSGSRLVITEAMHGAILADAYRVPWIPISTSSRINFFKWTDWAQSLGMNLKFNNFAPLGISDLFRTLTGDQTTGGTLKILLAEYGQNTNEGGDPSDHGSVLNELNRIYYITMPRFMREKLELRLFLKLGPAIDKIIDRDTGSGHVKPLLNKAAEKLRNLASGEGQLSNEQLSENKKSHVYEKITDIQRYLS